MPARPGLSPLRPGKGRRAEARARQRLERELAAGREHPDRATERLGQPGALRPPGPLIWLHARNSATALDLLPLVDRIRLERYDLNFLVTTDEYTAEAALESHLPDGCLHQFLPYADGPGFELFLNHWQPDICIWSDSDRLPPLLGTRQDGNITCFWVNASLPDEKSRKMRWLGPVSRKVIAQFFRIFTSDGRSARNLRRLGVPDERLAVTGPLHESPPPLECVESEWQRLAHILATRPVWFAANVSTDEAHIVVQAHRAISRRAHRYLLLLSPSDKASGASQARALEEDGWMVARRSADQDPDAETQIYLVDQDGEMGLWFRLAPISFIGQTLAPDSNPPCDPYLATALGSVVLHGPRTRIYADRFARLQNAGAARQVISEAMLVQEIERLQAPDKVASMAQAAWEISTRGAEATDHLCDLIHADLNDRGI